MPLFFCFMLSCIRYKDNTNRIQPPGIPIKGIPGGHNMEAFVFNS